jgi:hypothetical protein
MTIIPLFLYFFYTTMPIDPITRHLIDFESRKSCLEAKIGSLQKELDEIKESIRIIKDKAKMLSNHFC